MSKKLQTVSAIPLLRPNSPSRDMHRTPSSKCGRSLHTTPRHKLCPHICKHLLLCKQSSCIGHTLLIHMPHPPSLPLPSDQRCSPAAAEGRPGQPYFQAPKLHFLDRLANT